MDNWFSSEIERLLFSLIVTIIIYRSLGEKGQPIIPESARAQISSNRLRMFCAGDQQFTFKTM